MTHEEGSTDRPEASEDVILYEGDDLRVRHSPAAASRDLVITFTGRSSKPPVPKGFGEDFFRKRGIAAIHFISKDNHWWQTPETGVAVDLLKTKRLTDGFDRVTLYGSSMGGFASLIQSRALKPDHIIVVSPQYSINADVVPFERRWRNYAARLTFDFDDMPAGLDPSVRISAIVDPLFDPDVQHVRLIEKLRPVTRIPVPFAGHNTARMLEEAALMQRSLEQLVAGTFEIDVFRRTYRERRFGSSLFWFGMAECFAAHGRGAWSAAPAAIAADLIVKGARMRDPALRQEILRLAIRTAAERDDRAMATHWLDALRAAEPKPFALRVAEAQVAMLGDDPIAALAVAENARGDRPRDAVGVALTLDALVAAGQTERAVRAAAAASQPHRRVAIVQAAIARVQFAAGDAVSASATLQAVQRYDATSPAIRIMLAQDLFARGKGDGARRQLAPVIARTLARVSDRTAAQALAVTLGLTEQAERFARRNAQADTLYRLILTELSTIERDDLLATTTGLVARVGARLAGQR